MTSGKVRAAGIFIFVSTALGVIGAIVYFFAAFVGFGTALQDNPKDLSAAVRTMFDGAGWIVIAIVLVGVVVSLFALVALRGYLNRHAGYAGANILIRGIVVGFLAMVLFGVAGFLLGGGGIVLIVLGIIAVVMFVLYFALAFRLNGYAKAHEDGAMRVYAIMALAYCFSMVATVLLAMVAAAAPPLIFLVGIVGWINSLLQLAAWIALGVALISGANKMQEKGM